jgi:putative transposase
VKYATIEKYSRQFPISQLCHALNVSRSGFYAARNRPASRRSAEDLHLREQISRLHALHRQGLGTIRTWKLLSEEGIVCGKHRVARLRKLDGIVAMRTDKFRVMHAHQNSEPPAPDLLKRAFMVPSPNRVWVGDITTIHTVEGWLHLAIVLDLFARRVVGWAMDGRQQAALPIAALEMAFACRKPAAGLICHTDQGSVYGSNDYKAVLTQHHAKPSMSRRGNCHDNAVAESFFSTLKNELTHHTIYQTRAEAMAAISDYIELYYNPVRPHTTLKYRSPVQAENLALCA